MRGRILQLRMRNGLESHQIAQVRVGSEPSRAIKLKRGVRQRSVLSPLLFLLVVDPLLVTLADTEEGVSIRGVHTGSLCHADDLRSVTSNLSFLEKQVDIIQSFTSENSLTLNIEKLELLAMSDLTVQQRTISSSAMASCLDVVWSHNLSSKASIDSNINKARRAFGLGSPGIMASRIR